MPLCRLRPFDPEDLGLTGLLSTPGELATLESLFASGVCDWSRPGVGQGPAQTWLRYDARDGGVVYGGRNLPRLPRRSATGVVSPSFAEALTR